MIWRIKSLKLWSYEQILCEVYEYHKTRLSPIERKLYEKEPVIASKKSQKTVQQRLEIVPTQWKKSVWNRVKSTQEFIKIRLLQVEMV